MVPKFYAIDRAESVARRVARPLQCVQRALPPVHRRPDGRRRPDPAAARRRHEPRAPRRVPGRAQAPDRRVPRGRAHRPGRGGHAHGRLPPARAGGPPGDDPDPGRRNDRHLPGRRDGAATVHLQRPHPPGGHRGRRTATAYAASSMSSSLADRLMREGPHASLEPIVHDAPIVPETKPLDDLLAELQRERTSLAVVVDEYGRVVGRRHRRGHRRGGRRGDRRRDRSRRRRDSPSGQRRLVRSRARGRHRPGRLRAATCRWTATPTTRSEASCSPSSAGCPGGGTPSTRTASRSAWSRCATTASRPSASASAVPRHRGEGRETRRLTGPDERGPPTRRGRVGRARPLSRSGPRGERTGPCALGGGGCALRLGRRIHEYRQLDQR